MGHTAPMMKKGPIPLFLHGVVEYVAAALLITAPFLLSFDSGAATALSVVIGVVLLAIAASTDGPTSLINNLPRAAHVALDYVLVVALIALPFLAGFSDETAPTAFFIVLGVAHLLITIGTRFETRRELHAEDGGADRIESEPGSPAETGLDAPEPAGRLDDRDVAPPGPST
jgi:hypothetical protein